MWNGDSTRARVTSLPQSTDHTRVAKARPHKLDNAGRERQKLRHPSSCAAFGMVCGCRESSRVCRRHVAPCAALGFSRAPTPDPPREDPPYLSGPVK